MPIEQCARDGSHKLTGALVAGLCVATALGALWLKPLASRVEAVKLDRLIPSQIGDWRVDPRGQAQVALSTYAQGLSDAIYDDVLMRSYVDADGQHLQLAMAYAREQRQDVKIHQPEVCYPAQGFRILALQTHRFALAAAPRAIAGKHALFIKDGHLEAVSYWIRIGDDFPLSGFEMRWLMLRDGLLQGRVDDGVLVRVSSPVDDAAQAPVAYALHERFLQSLVLALDDLNPGLLLPVPHS